VADGKVWLFAVVDHWNAEAMGWHIAKIGNRYAAVQAVGMAIKTEFSAVAAGIARGLALRHDHGSAFMADHFQSQIKFCGMAPSFEGAIKDTAGKVTMVSLILCSKRALVGSRVTSSCSHERLQTVGQTAVTLSSSSALDSL
jgi:hypothetical protein